MWMSEMCASSRDLGHEDELVTGCDSELSIFEVSMILIIH